MGIVNRYAKGLLNILDSQTQGDTPSSMGDVIAPTMDLSEFLFASKRSEVQGATVTLTGLGIGSLVTVPAGETWWLRNVVGEAVSREGVGATMRWAIYVTTLTNNYPVCVSQNASFPTTGTTLPIDPAHLPKPIVLLQGDQLVCQLVGVTGVPVLGWNFNVTWVFDKMTA